MVGVVKGGLRKAKGPKTANKFVTHLMTMPHAAGKKISSSLSLNLGANDVSQSYFGTHNSNF